MKQKAKRRQPRIAVIEETADNIYSIKFILQSLGYDVSSFSAESPFLQALEAFTPRLVVVDMMIPNRVAFRAIREVKSSRSQDVPVLAITADAMEGNEEEVFAAGGQDILAKPYSVAELQEKLKQWLPAEESEDNRLEPEK